MSVFENVLMVVLVSILSELDSVKSIECPTVNDTKCETFWQKLFIYPGHNLHEGLKCLKYNGNITYLEAFEDYSAPQKIDIDIIRSAHLQLFKFSTLPKGQIISKCLYGVIVWTKKPTKFFPGFLP